MFLPRSASIGELKDVAVAPDYSPKLAVPGRMQFVLKKDSPDTELGLTLFGVGDALICANLAVESAAYQAWPTRR